VIQRIVLIKLDEENATEANRRTVAEHSRKILAAVPGVLRVDVGMPADDASAQNWDISLVLRFASFDDLEPFRVDPEHRSYVDDFLKPKLATIRAWNFEIG